MILYGGMKPTNWLSHTPFSRRQASLALCVFQGGEESRSPFAPIGVKKQLVVPPSGFVISGCMLAVVNHSSENKEVLCEGTY